MVRICYLKKSRRPKKGVGYEPLGITKINYNGTLTLSVSRVFEDLGLGLRLGYLVLGVQGSWVHEFSCGCFYGFTDLCR